MATEKPIIGCTFADRCPDWREGVDSSLSAIKIAQAEMRGEVNTMISTIAQSLEFQKMRHEDLMDQFQRTHEETHQILVATVKEQAEDRRKTSETVGKIYERIDQLSDRWLKVAAWAVPALLALAGALVAYIYTTGHAP